MTRVPLSSYPLKSIRHNSEGSIIKALDFTLNLRG